MAYTITKSTITADGAIAMIDAARKKAEAMGVPMCIAVCDEAGIEKAFLRMDGAPLLSVEVSKDKAYTAVGFGMATEDWYPFIKDDGPLAAGAPKVPRLIIFGGGYPVKEGGAIVAGIGVSGGHYSHDMEVAKAGLAAFNELAMGGSFAPQ